MKHKVLIFRSKLKYEFHPKPKVSLEKYIWGGCIEFRFLKYRIEFRYINRKIADEIVAEIGRTLRFPATTNMKKTKNKSD